MSIRKMLLLSLSISFLSLWGMGKLYAQKWPTDCKEVQIISSLDQEMQSAYFFKSKGKNPRPLLISLHTWSGDYTQKDTLSWMCIDKNYNYIHPDFRGKNNKPKACGSKFAIQDIDDAITYAIKHGNVDQNEIHIIGNSGGGHATLFAYMKTTYQVKTFSAWVPISDIGKWFYESKGRGNKYALDIAKSTMKGMMMDKEHYLLGEEEAEKRSPFYMQTPIEKRKNSKLFIYAGIHDGYQGSVPITQSLTFFNKVVQDYDSTDQKALIPNDHILEMLASQNFISEKSDKIEDRHIHYQRKYQDLLQVTIFEGGHEILSNVAINHIEPRKILTIGDSNGAAKDGWVTQLKGLRFGDFIYNTSISGNTIGFDNQGKEKLNSLKNIDSYLNQSSSELGGLSDIIILLGTNDCKAVFDEKINRIPKNLKQLILKIKAHPAYQTYKPRILIVSPPPYGKDDIMLEKYHGGAARVASLIPKFQKVAEKNDCDFIDIHTPLVPYWETYAKDGVHLIEKGQILIGTMIHTWLEN